MERFIILQRELTGSTAGPWVQSDAQGEPIPHNKHTAAYLLRMIMENNHSGHEFEVMMIDDAGVSDVTLSIQILIEHQDHEVAHEAYIDAQHERIEGARGVFV